MLSMKLLQNTETIQITAEVLSFFIHSAESVKLFDSLCVFIDLELKHQTCTTGHSRKLASGYIRCSDSVSLQKYLCKKLNEYSEEM